MAVAGRKSRASAELARISFPTEVLFKQGTAMLSDHPSQTLLGSAINRAQHQLLDAPVILNDPVVTHLVPEAMQLSVPDEYRRGEDRIPSLLRAMFAMRSRFAEDRLAEAVQRGADQYLIIGAGLDTFPWRQPQFAREIAIFAVDHPQSLAWVDRRLNERGLVRPGNLTRVPIDLEGEKIEHALAANGFDYAKTTFCSLLGVTQYLGSDDVARLLRFAGALSRGSEIVLSFVSPDEELEGIDLDIARRAASRTGALGEPWKYRPRANDLEAVLVSAGFRDVFHLTPELAQARYFVNRTDELRAPIWEQLFAAVV